MKRKEILLYHLLSDVLFDALKIDWISRTLMEEQTRGAFKILFLAWKFFSFLSWKLYRFFCYGFLYQWSYIRTVKKCLCKLIEFIFDLEVFITVHRRWNCYFWMRKIRKKYISWTIYLYSHWIMGKQYSSFSMSESWVLKILWDECFPEQKILAKDF